jgi:hypothetical protein
MVINSEPMSTVTSPYVSPNSLPSPKMQETPSKVMEDKLMPILAKLMPMVHNEADQMPTAEGGSSSYAYSGI